MKITIPGEFTTLNQLRKSSDHHRQGDVEVRNYVKDRYPPITEYPVRMSFDWYRPNDNTDHDNIIPKGVLDGLVMAGILKNDCPAYVDALAHNFFVDEDNPRVVVHITHSPTLGRWVWQEASE